MGSGPYSGRQVSYRQPGGRPAPGRLTGSIASVLIWTIATLVAGVLLWIVLDLIRFGLPYLSLEFLLDTPRDAGRAGGIAPVLVATGLILAVCLAVTVPLGLATALLLAEFSARDHLFGRLVRRSLDVLAGVPSIVFGLFGNAFFVLYLGMGYSILAGGLTLACMVLPLFVRAGEQAFRSVPGDYRRAAAALGLSRIAVIRSVLFPMALPGLLVGLVLSTGRALAEAAALLFTSGQGLRMAESLGDSGRTLAIHVYEMAMHVPGGEGQAYATALTLITLILIINLVTVGLGRRYLRGRMH